MASNPKPDADMASIPEPDAIPGPDAVPDADMASIPEPEPDALPGPGAVPEPDGDLASNPQPGGANEASNPPKAKRDRRGRDQKGRKRSCCVPGCIPSGFVHHKIPANSRAQWLMYVLITNVWLRERGLEECHVVCFFNERDHPPMTYAVLVRVT